MASTIIYESTNSVNTHIIVQKYLQYTGILYFFYILTVYCIWIKPKQLSTEPRHTAWSMSYQLSRDLGHWAVKHSKKCLQEFSKFSKQANKSHCFWLSKTRQYFMFTYNLTGLDLCCIYFIYTRFKTNIHVHLHVSIILHTYINMFVHLNMQPNSFTSYQIFYLMKLLAILLNNL